MDARIVPFIMREPVSAGTHFFAFLFAIPSCLFLLRFPNELKKKFFLSVFSAAMLFCYFSSFLYHSVYSHPELFREIDYVGIYFFICATYTVILFNKNFSRELYVLWTVATCFCIDLLITHDIKEYRFLLIGWLPLCCPKVFNLLFKKEFLSVFLGGVLYSIGAAIGFTRKEFWPGIIHSHEVFHVFVMLGTSFQYYYVLKYVALNNESRHIFTRRVESCRLVEV